MDKVIFPYGTRSSFVPGHERNAGLPYTLLPEIGRSSVFCEAGVQWPHWCASSDAVTGRGIIRQVRRAKGCLAFRYRPGDRVFLMGYRRGVYAARALAGVIDRFGLLHALHAVERNIRQVYPLSQYDPEGAAAGSVGCSCCAHLASSAGTGPQGGMTARGLSAPRRRGSARRKRDEASPTESTFFFTNW